MSFLCISFGLTDTGRRRSHNEDFLGVYDDSGLYLVADGVGGSSGGERASLLAVEIIADRVIGMLSGSQPVFARFPDTMPYAERVLGSACYTANTVIYQTGIRSPALQGMCTTIVAMLLQDEHIAVAHAGDSRMYRLRDGVLEQMTIDHSLVQEQYQKGLISCEEMAASDLRHIVMRVLGAQSDVEISLASYDILVGDRYLLCSDGLTTMVSDGDIKVKLLGAETPRKACEKLVSAANAAGGADNISVVSVWIEPTDDE